jgi:hypothetical protein
MNSQAQPSGGSTGKEQFAAAIGAIVTAIGDRALDAGLETWLNTAYPPGNDTFEALAILVLQGVQESWLCEHQTGRLRHGRIIEPGTQAGRFSVDVVLMEDMQAQHHAHPAGEIGLILPWTPAAHFEGKREGWYVAAPGSAHSPEVTGGAAFVLYLRPDGAISYTPQQPAA